MGDFEDPRQAVLEGQNEKRRAEKQAQNIENLKKQIADLTSQNEAKQAMIDEAVKRETKTMTKLEKMEEKMEEFRTKYEETEVKIKNFKSENEGNEARMKGLSQENERLAHELKLAQDRV